MGHATNSMKKVIRIFIFIFSIIVISNILPVKTFVKTDDCRYSTGDGGFTFEEMNFMDADFRMCQNRFHEYKKNQIKDTILYRLCPMNALHFWDYGEYLFSKRYHLPFKSWQSIENIRGTITNKTGYQDF